MYTLDVKDRKILRELDLDARLSYASLGRKVRLSKQVVQYRVARLEAEGIIQGYNAIVDVSKIGQTIYVVYVKLILVSSKEEKQWISSIQKHSNVLAVGRNAGQWDLTIVMRCVDNRQVDTILKEITAGKAGKVTEKLITSEIESTYFALNLLQNGGRQAISTSDEKVEIDVVDEAIISSLSENCRTSLLTIGKNVDISPNGVKKRIQKLEKNGVLLGYRTKINFEKLGFIHFRVFLHLNDFSPKLYESIKEFLHLKGNVESISRYAGYADVDFRCYSNDITGLYDLISEIKDQFLPNIIGVDSVIIFGWDKMNYYPNSKTVG